MPKFLDVPSWYTTDGTLVSAWTEKPGYATVLKGNSDGACKWERPAVSYCNDSMNGGAVIFAPTSGGKSGQILVSNGSGAPVWKDSNFIELPKDAVSYNRSTLSIDLSSITDWNTSYYVFGTAYAGSSSSSSNIIFYISGLVMFDGFGRLSSNTAIALGFGTIGFTSNTVDAQLGYRAASTNYQLTFNFNLFTNDNYNDMTITSSSAPYSARLFAIKTSINSFI